MTVDTERWVGYLQSALDDRREVAAIAEQIEGGLPLDDAYRIQRALVGRKVAAGDRIAGAKLGLTSTAKQQQMGVSEPVYGSVLGSSLLGPTARVALGDLIQPRAEPEFVFLMGRDLSGPDVTAADVLDATASVVGGIEIIDSRYEKFKFSLADVIADNTSAARVAVGSSGARPGQVDLTAVTCSFVVDGKEVASATGEALLGDPAWCVALLARHLYRYGEGLKAGWTVLAGAPTDAHPLLAGAVVEAHFSHFSTVRVEAV